MNEGFPEPAKQPVENGDFNIDDGTIVDAEIVKENGSEEPKVNPTAAAETHNPDAIDAEIVDEDKEAQAKREREQRDVGNAAIRGSGLLDGLSALLVAAAAARSSKEAPQEKTPTTPPRKTTPPKKKGATKKTPTPHEKPNHEDQGQFGPAEQVGYAPDEAGEVQLAEHYVTPGTQIEWDRPGTSTGDPWNASERKAVITTVDGKTYYLRGATLYDVNASTKARRLITMGDTKMPDVTIGEATMFSDGQAVTDITIATEKVRAENLDPKVNMQPRNIFNLLDDTIDQFQQGRQRREKAAPPRYEEPVTSGPNTLGTPETYAYSFRDHDTIPGAVTNLHGRWNELDNTVPLQMSHEGVPISPRETITPPKYDLEKVTELYGNGSDEEKATLREYMQEVDDKKAQDFIDKRTRAYEPRVIEGAILGVKETAKENTKEIAEIIGKTPPIAALGRKLAARRVRRANKPKWRPI